MAASDLVSRPGGPPKPTLAPERLAGAGVGGQDEDGVAEVGLATVVVGQRRVVHDLEQDVVDVLVGLLDLVHDHDAVWGLVDGIGESNT